MPDFDYSTLLRIVDAILAGAPQEEHIRTAANRAYYAVYGTFRQTLAVKFSTDCFDEAGCHRQLVAVCKTNSNPGNLKSLGTDLSGLLHLRESADYKWGEQVPLNRVVDARRNAARLIEKIRSLRDQELTLVYQGIQSRPVRR